MNRRGVPSGGNGGIVRGNAASSAGASAAASAGAGAGSGGGGGGGGGVVAAAASDIGGGRVADFQVAERPVYDTESFSPEVNAAINAVVPSDDPLDQPEFDAVAFVNARFPDENSLEGVGTYAQEVESRITELDRDIYTAIREQAVCVCVCACVRVCVCK
jgi:hypothetical protein